MYISLQYVYTSISVILPVMLATLNWRLTVRKSRAYTIKAYSVNFVHNAQLFHTFNFLIVSLFQNFKEKCVPTNMFDFLFKRSYIVWIEKFINYSNVKNKNKDKKFLKNHQLPQQNYFNNHCKSKTMLFRMWFL